jgi:predicted ATPase
MVTVAQPVGLVTLVFTDIEGSTRLLRELGEGAYRQALEEHRARVRTAFGARSGYEVGCEGDSFFFAFASATDAIWAASEALAALEDGPIRIRVGVHSGEPALDPPQYVGIDVHKAARVMAAGHGGQVLLSQSTREMLADELDVRYLGEYRLKDFPGPERLYQFGSGAFPPLHSLYHTNLPAPATSFIGRKQELTELIKLLRTGERLITLTGPGGVGKTRLALAVAELQPEPVLVSLAPVNELGLVRTVIADALGLKDETTLANWRWPRELLLVLDNFEHLLGAASVVTELLTAAPGLQVLATSRTPLNLSGEHQYVVSPLPEADAVDLFVERAAAVDADVGPSDAVGEICRHLDCLPLAIELAATRAKMLPPESLLARLEERLAILTRGPRDAPERHRSLRATIEWSFALLAPEEQRLFARLGVFRGGCTLAAAEHICGATLETLQALVDESLLGCEGERLTMLETIHAYARESLRKSGEGELIMRRLVEWLTEIAETFDAEAALSRAPSIEQLQYELDNLRAALRAALGWPHDPLALRLTTALLRFWTMTGRHSEGLRWTAEALDRAADPLSPEYAQCLRAAVQLATIDANVELALTYGERALAIFRGQHDDLGVADVLPWLGSAYAQVGDATRVRELHAESVALNEAAADVPRLARALRLAGEDELELGDASRAVELIERALKIARSANRGHEIAMTLHSLGDAYLVRGDVDDATRSYLAALGQGDHSVSVLETAYCLAGLAAVAAREGRVDVAGSLWGAVTAYERNVGGRLIYPHARRRYEAALEPIDGAEFVAAVGAGGELTLHAASGLAVNAFGEARPAHRANP